MDITITDNEGLTAIHLAARNGDFEVVEYLEAARGENNLRNEEERGLWPISSLYDFYRHESSRVATSNPPRYIDWSTIAVEQSIEAVNCLAATIFEGTWHGSNVSIIKPIVGKTFSFTIKDARGPTDDRCIRRMFVNEVCRWIPQNHPHVVRLFGAGHRGQPYFVAEHTNSNLRSYLSTHKYRVWLTLYQVALGLEYLHERGFVHERLHGDAIAIGDDGLPKLRGFGFFLVKSDGSGRELEDQQHWFSPEVFLGGKLSAENDVWSLGMCIIEAVSGDLPYAKEVAEGLNVRDLVGSKQLPKRHPSFRDQEWSLVTRMCCQRGERLTMPAVILELEDLARRESENETRKALSARTTTTIGELEDLLERAYLSCEGNHSETPIDRPRLELLPRLSEMIVRLRATNAAASALSGCSTLLTRFIGISKQRTVADEVSGYAVGRQLANSVFALHCELDRHQRAQGVPVTGYWRETWQNSWVDQQSLFGEELREVMLLTSLPPENREAQVEKLICMLFELVKHGSNYAAIPTQVTIAARKQIQTVLGEKMRDWFLPWYEVQLNSTQYFKRGGFGEVYHGEWMGSKVVLKKLHPEKFDESTFIREVEIWFKLSHPNVLKLFGACHVGQQFFVSEWAGHGQLDAYLREHRNLVWEKLHEVALGLQYLHANMIIHCDLKCNNILVGLDGKAKVSDFGLSSISRETEIGTAQQKFGNVRWAAPEVMGGAAPSRESDIYSLGMCIIEAISGRMPYFHQGDNKLIRARVLGGRFHHQPEEFESKAHWELVLKCCEYDSSKRASLPEIAAMLRKFADEERQRINATAEKKVGDSIRCTAIKDQVEQPDEPSGLAISKASNCADDGTSHRCVESSELVQDLDGKNSIEGTELAPIGLKSKETGGNKCEGDSGAENLLVLSLASLRGSFDNQDDCAYSSGVLDKAATESQGELVVEGLSTLALSEASARDEYARIA